MDGEGVEVDIHKPKPIHSIREFLVELLTIVIGVLIALSAEALVEHLRIDRAVAYSRADFTNELQSNRAAAEKNLVESRRLQTRLETLLEEGTRYVEGKGAFGPQHELSRSFTQLRSAAWSAALSAQVMGHFPHDEERAVAAAYEEQASFEKLQQEAQRSWFELAVYSFSGPPTRAEIGETVRHVTVSYAYLRAIEDEESGLINVYDRALGALRAQ